MQKQQTAAAEYSSISRSSSIGKRGGSAFIGNDCYFINAAPVEILRCCACGNFIMLQQCKYQDAAPVEILRCCACSGNAANLRNVSDVEKTWSLRIQGWMFWMTIWKPDCPKCGLALCNVLTRNTFLQCFDTEYFLCYVLTRNTFMLCFDTKYFFKVENRVGVWPCSAMCRRSEGEGGGDEPGKRAKAACDLLPCTPPKFWGS